MKMFVFAALVAATFMLAGPANAGPPDDVCIFLPQPAIEAVCNR